MPAYTTLLKQLYSINRSSGMKLGLDNVQRLNKALGDPVKEFQTIHVAGTNGKGSVSTKIAAALQFSGKKVGLYTSPHLSCFRERIRINQTMISENEMLSLLPLILETAKQLTIPATFFELTTMLAFLHFAKNDIEIAVIETGLGGRLDATNIVKPLLTTITSIGLDHTEVLGNTLEQIAMEKAGIIKPGIPLVIGPKVPYDLMKKETDKYKSSCIEVSGIFASYEEENRAIAKRCLEILGIPPIHITQGLEITPSCRMQLFHHKEIPIILDVAHNPDGIAALITSLQHRFPHSNFRTICGFSSNKDIVSCVSLLQKISSHFYLVQSASNRSLSKESLQNILLSLGQPKSTITIPKTVQEIFALVQKDTQPNEMVLVCGSFFIMGEIREALGINEPHDPFNLN